jgi:hypothetical protein
MKPWSLCCMLALLPPAPLGANPPTIAPPRRRFSPALVSVVLGCLLYLAEQRFRDEVNQPL